MKHGKNYVNASQKIEAGKLYESNEALALAIETATAKFDETIEGKKWILQFKKEDGNIVTLEGTSTNEFLNRMICDENNHSSQFVKFEVEA